MKMFMTLLLLLCGWLPQADAREIVHIASVGRGYIMSTADYCKNTAVPQFPPPLATAPVVVPVFQTAYVPFIGSPAVMSPYTQVVPVRAFGFGRRHVFGSHFGFDYTSSHFGATAAVRRSVAMAEPIGAPKESGTITAGDAGRETRNKLNQFCAYLHDNVPVWYEQARVWTVWHPNETLAYAFGTAFALAWLFRRRREVNGLKARVHELQLELDSVEDRMQDDGKTYILSSGEIARPAGGGERYDDTTMHDVLAKFAEVQDASLRQVASMHTTTVEHLRATQENALDLLKVQQNNVNATIQGACKQAIDAAHVAAKASAEASSRSATEAQTKMLEVVKVAVEALRVANIEHAKAEAATVVALSTTAQRSIDGTRNLVDALTENKDQQ